MSACRPGDKNCQLSSKEYIFGKCHRKFSWGPDYHRYMWQFLICFICSWNSVAQPLVLYRNRILRCFEFHSSTKSTSWKYLKVVAYSQVVYEGFQEGKFGNCLDDLLLIKHAFFYQIPQRMKAFIKGTDGMSLCCFSYSASMYIPSNFWTLIVLWLNKVINRKQSVFLENFYLFSSHVQSGWPGIRVLLSL